ncbi:hypothetical protein GJ496_002345 [Pomphorhynchus laevis]|nr:hypothetical protein GJ496_002345 [Pomphorhynchus laevis]
MDKSIRKRQLCSLVDKLIACYTVGNWLRPTYHVRQMLYDVLRRVKTEDMRFGGSQSANQIVELYGQMSVVWL